MTKTNIRQASVKDLDVTYSLVRKASKWLQETYGFKHWSNYYTVDKVKDNFETRTVYLIYENDIPVATYTKSTNPPPFYVKQDIEQFEDPNAVAYYLTTVCVDPDYHGKGYAKMIIPHLEKSAKENNIKYIRFNARGDYKELTAFYLKNGYTIVGRVTNREDYYPLFEKRID